MPWSHRPRRLRGAARPSLNVKQRAPVSSGLWLSDILKQRLFSSATERDKELRLETATRYSECHGFQASGGLLL